MHFGLYYISQIDGCSLKNMTISKNKLMQATCLTKIMSCVIPNLYKCI